MAPNGLTNKLAITRHHYNIANLETINFKRLKQGDATEIQRLIQNCKNPGFFHLDLKDDQGYLDALEALYKAEETYFDQSAEIKMNDFRQSQDRGFKPGDDAETLEISRDEVLQGLSAIPDSLKSSSQLIESFISTSHQITLTILALLSESLGISFEKHHVEGESSDCGLKMESVPLSERLEDVPPSEHTDMGTLTLLYCPQYTTELNFPGTEDWGFIVPKLGHAIVNVADSLQAMSNGQLKSCLHRVGQPVPGAGRRNCVLYYLRPDSSFFSKE